MSGGIVSGKFYSRAEGHTVVSDKPIQRHERDGTFRCIGLTDSLGMLRYFAETDGGFCWLSHSEALAVNASMTKGDSGECQ